MKKKNAVIAMSALALIFGLVLSGCASLEQKIDGSLIATKWDKNEKSTAVLYFDEKVRIHSIDGKEPTNIYGQATKLTGSGTVRKPKVQVALPAGERTLVISYTVRSGNNAEWELPREVTYTFVAGRYYQLVATTNEDVKNPAFDALAERIRADTESAALGQADGTVRGMGAGIGAGFATQAAGAKELFELASTTPQYAMNLEVIDITGGKKRNSPSQVITVKGW